MLVDDIASELVEVPAWDCTILVKSTNARERAELLNLLTSDDEDARRVQLFPLILALTAHDPETGERLFARDDVSWIAEKNGKVVQEVAMVGMKLAGLVADAVDEGKDDSSETTTGDTDSDSPRD